LDLFLSDGALRRERSWRNLPVQFRSAVGLFLKQRGQDAGCATGAHCDL